MATIEKNGLRISGEYALNVAPGMDPVLVVSIVVAMIDRARTQQSASAGAAGGAAA